MGWFKWQFGGGVRLGRLEAEMLEHVWNSGQLTVRELHSRYQDRLAYTTVMTTLDRLHKKGMLNRHKDGRAFVYSPALTRAEFGERLARHAMDVMLNYAEPSASYVMSYFVEAIGDSNHKLLDELERAVKARRERERRS